MSGIIRFWFAPVLLLVGGAFLAAVVDGDDAVDLPVKYYPPKGAAASGYDVVAYFDKDKAVRGNNEIQAHYGGRVWLFENAESRKKFVDAPEKYVPQYGGHCAYAVGNGYYAKGDPEAWTVRHGKLYLNFSKGVRNNWLADPDGYIASGDKNWPGVLQKITKDRANK